MTTPLNEEELNYILKHYWQGSKESMKINLEKRIDIAKKEKNLDLLKILERDYNANFSKP